MTSQRNNAVVMVLNAPETESTFKEMKDAFGQERAVHINKDLYVNLYSNINSYENAIKIIAYSKTQKHPDLTWLSVEDPGFLECHGKDYQQMLSMGASLAFTTGCNKAVYINHLCPFITKEHLDFAFSKITDKNMVFGASPQGHVYLVGLSREHLKALENFSLFQENFLEDIMEKAKRNKASFTGMEDLEMVTDEASLKKWLETKTNSSSIFSDILKQAEQTNHKKKRRHNDHKNDISAVVEEHNPAQENAGDKNLNEHEVK